MVEQNNKPLLKIAGIMLAIGVMAGGYFVAFSGEDYVAPFSCQANSDCELRGLDEWESCDHKAAPHNEAQRRNPPAHDQTSKTQEGYACVCLPSAVCGWQKPGGH